MKNVEARKLTYNYNNRISVCRFYKCFFYGDWNFAEMAKIIEVECNFNFHLYKGKKGWSCWESHTPVLGIVFHDDFQSFLDFYGSQIKKICMSLEVK